MRTSINSRKRIRVVMSRPLTTTTRPHPSGVENNDLHTREKERERRLRDSVIMASLWRNWYFSFPSSTLDFVCLLSRFQMAAKQHLAFPSNLVNFFRVLTWPKDLYYIYNMPFIFELLFLTQTFPWKKHYRNEKRKGRNKRESSREKGGEKIDDDVVRLTVRVNVGVLTSNRPRPISSVLGASYPLLQIPVRLLTISCPARDDDDIKRWLPLAE